VKQPCKNGSNISKMEDEERPGQHSISRSEPLDCPSEKYYVYIIY
jgi:hypothetical protein